MQKIFTISLLFLVVSAFAQEEVTGPKIKHENHLKVGFSNQIDVIIFNRYDDYYYPDDNYYYRDPGINFQVFLAYEHVWEFPNKTAIGLEPRIGASIREKLNEGIASLNTKFYWVSHPVWRMGIALYGGYGYSSFDVSVNVPMDGGNYYQRRDLQMNLHSFSFDVGLIPFQFRFERVPIVIESIFSLGGVTVINGRSEPYQDSYSNDRNLIDNYSFPYFLKAEFKVGYNIPGRKQGN